MKVLQNNANLGEIESRLNKYSFLSRYPLPGAPDGLVFAILENIKRFPDRRVNPHFYHWYILMKQFSRSTIMKWVTDNLYYDQKDTLINEFLKLYTPKKDILVECSELAASECRSNKVEGSSQIQYSIDIALKDYDIGRINQLRRLLDSYKAQMGEDEVNSTRHIRIVCRIDPINLQEFSEKVSRCIQFNELSLRKKDMRTQKVVLAAGQQQKVQ